MSNKIRIYLSHPINTGEKILYLLLFCILLISIFGPVATADTDMTGNTILAPSTTCITDEDSWLQPELAVGVVDSNQKHNDANSARYDAESNPLECSGFDLADRKPINTTVGLNAALVVDELFEAPDHTKNPSINSTSTQAQVIDEQSAEEPNITSVEPSYDVFVARLLISEDGLSWIPLHNISELDFTGQSIDISVPKDFMVTEMMKIRIQPLEIPESTTLFVDSMYIAYEVGAQQKITVEGPKGDNLADDPGVFEVGSEDVNFTIKTKPNNSGTLQGIGNKINGVFKKQKPTDDITVSAQIVAPDLTVNTQVETKWIDKDVGNNDVWQIHVDAPQQFVPGLHTAQFVVTDQDGFEQTYEQDFMWGVLALNTDKDVYSRNEIANIEFGVLDDNGKMVCDAEVILQIQGPGYHEVLSTENGKIIINDVCPYLEYTETPDYEANWRIPNRVGRYDFTLTASTSNGDHTITQTIDVVDSPQIVFSRAAPTRIYPPLFYPVEIKIDSTIDFNGRIEEVIPTGFEITEMSELTDINGDIVSSKPTISQANDKKNIIWEEVTINANQPVFARYTFDAPDISPEFWLLGPVNLSGSENHVEQRSWQIASDAIAVQNVSGTAPVITTGSLTAQVTLNVASGATMVMVSSGTNGTPVVSTVTDNNGDTYVRAGGSGSSPTNEVWYSVSPTVNAAKVITVTYTGTANSAIGAMSLTGTLTSSPIDHVTTSTGTANAVSTTFSTNVANSLIYWSVTDGNNGSYSSHGAGQTERYQGNTGGAGGKYSHLVTTEITTTAGSNNQTSNLSKTSTWQAIGIEIKAAPTSINISGTTNVTSGTVRVAYGGTLQAQTATISGGTWTITGAAIPTTGQVVTVWVDGAAEADESTAVTKYSGTGNITGMVLNKHVLSVGSASGQSLTVANLGSYTNTNDEDILHTSVSGVLNVTAGGHADDSIRVLSGNTLTLAASQTLTVYTVTIDGTLTSTGAGAINISGSWDNNSVFNAGTKTMTFTSTTAQTIDSTGASVAGLNNVTFNGSGGTWTNNSAHTISGNLVITAGTLNGSNNITVNGGNVTGNGTINMSGGTFLVDGAGNFGGNTSWTFNNLSFGDNVGLTTTTSTGTGNISINGVLTISTNQTLTLATKSWFLNGSGTPLVINGTFNHGTSTVEYNGSAATNVTNTTYYNLSFKPTSGSTIFTALTGTFTVNNNLVVGNGTNAATLEVNTNDPIIDVNNNFTVAAGATFSASNASSLSIAANFTNNGTFTHNSGTIVFDTTTTSIITGDNTRFNNFNVSTNNKTLNFASTQNFGFDGLLSITGAIGNPIHIHSTISTSRWLLDFQGTKSINYAHIQDGGCKVGTQNLDLTTTTNTDDTNNDVCWFASNTAPDVPTALVQAKTDDTVLATGDWTNETSVKFTANATDTDNPDTLELCIEIDLLGTPFSDTQDSCGTGVAYVGSAVVVTHTITGITDASQYHWQARIRDAAGDYSGWVSYGGNAETVRDVGIDTTSPTGGTVFDGGSVGVDADFNTGELNTLTANWSGINTTASGLSGYEYAIGTTPGAADVVSYTSNGTSTSVTSSGLTLDTSNIYYFSIRTTDNASNQSIITSDGLRVAPTLTFSTSPGNVSFDNLNSGNGYTSTKDTTLTTSTNAYNGYVIRAFVDGVLTSQNSDTIGFFDGGSYAAPDEWLGGDTGYGYTSNDTDIQGTNIFSPATCAGGGSPPCYAPFSNSAPGDIVADHTALVSGSPIINENFIITHRTTTLATQPAGTYTSEVIYVVNAIY